jgi:hypothetical protein
MPILPPHVSNVLSWARTRTSVVSKRRHDRNSELSNLKGNASSREADGLSAYKCLPCILQSPIVDYCVNRNPHMTSVSNPYSFNNFLMLFSHPLQLQICINVSSFRFVLNVSSPLICHHNNVLRIIRISKLLVHYLLTQSSQVYTLSSAFRSQTDLMRTNVTKCTMFRSIFKSRRFQASYFADSG